MTTMTSASPGIGAQMSRDDAIAARYQLRCVTDRLDRTCSTLVDWRMAEREPSWAIGRPSPLLTDAEQVAVVAEYAREMGVSVQTWPLTRGTVSLVATGSFEGGVTVQVVAEPLRDPNAPAVPHAVEPPAEHAGETSDETGPQADRAEAADDHNEAPAGGAR